MCETSSEGGSYSYFGYYTNSPAEVLISVEDACGTGVAVADLNSTEYLTLFSDTIVALNDDTLDTVDGGAGPFAATIPAEDIESQCEVGYGSTAVARIHSTMRCSVYVLVCMYTSAAYLYAECKLCTYVLLVFSDSPKITAMLSWI